MNAAKNRYAGTSNHTRIWTRTEYHWNASRSGVASAIAKRSQVPIVSSFRNRARNNSAANHTSMMTTT